MFLLSVSRDSRFCAFRFSGNQKGDCTFQQDVSILNVKVNVQFADGDKKQLDSDLIQILFASERFYLLSL